MTVSTPQMPRSQVYPKSVIRKSFLSFSNDRFGINKNNDMGATEEYFWDMLQIWSISFYT